MLKEKTVEKEIIEELDPPRTESPKSMDRRSVIRKLAVGTAALAGCSVLPDRWTTPLVEFGALPAHATTSGDLAELVAALEDEGNQGEEVAQDEAVTADASGVDEAAGTADASADAQSAAEVEQQQEVDEAVNDELHGYTRSLTIMNTGAKMSCDSIWQDKFVFSGLGPDYGPSFLLVWSDGRELHVPSSAHMVMNTDINDFRKFQPGGVYSGNNPDIPSMEVYAARGTHPDSLTLYY